jgi:hypothetical protein
MNFNALGVQDGVKLQGLAFMMLLTTLINGTVQEKLKQSSLSSIYMPFDTGQHTLKREHVVVLIADVILFDRSREVQIRPLFLCQDFFFSLLLYHDSFLCQDIFFRILLYHDFS